MATIKGSKTEANLKRAFAAESLASRRCLSFAARADLDGCDQIGALFRAIADRRGSHARQHLETLEPCGDCCKSESRPDTTYNVRAAIMNELHESGDQYPIMARTARQEGLDEIAEWFEVLAKASRSHAGRFRRVLETLL
jgi:rubrerythrin